DNVPVLEPSFLFDTPQYRETGAIFWPDLIRLRADNPIWAICRVPYRNVPSFESGQIVVDKQRCWRARQLTFHLNAHSDFYYEHVYGDKETYHMAWLMLDQAFSMPASRSRRLPLTLCQHDFDGRLLFQHRNRAKWVLLGHNRPIPDFLYVAECLAFIAALKTLWNGQIFH